jgi:hypothetical protein
MSTLLLVILVPRFLPAQLVPLGLGLHKSMEMASSALSQTLSGMWLDRARAADGAGSGDGSGSGEGAGEGAADESENAWAVSGLVRAFLLVNVAQLVCVVALWRFEAARRKENEAAGVVQRAEEYERLPMNDLPALDSSDDDEDDDEAEAESMKRYRTLRGAGGLGERKASAGGGARVERSRRASGADRGRSPDEGYEDGSGVGERDGAGGEFTGPTSALARDEGERGRSRVFLGVSVGWIGVVWAVFLVDAYMDLL